jgi:hypothetical protein
VEFSSDLILTSLDKIASSAAFRLAARQRSFLRHIVQETLEGRSEDLKEYSIGIAVFGRDPSGLTDDHAARTPNIAIGFFRRAIDRDRKFARAYTNLNDMAFQWLNKAFDQKEERRSRTLWRSPNKP